MHPIVFELPGGGPLRSYGALVAVALLVGWILSLSNAKAKGLPVEKLGVAYVLAAVCGLLGARALWVVQHTDAYTGPLSLLRLQAGELALGGGLLAGGLATWGYCKKEGIATAQWLDALAGPLLLGLCLERLGALLAGTDFGLYAPGNPLGIRFPSGSPAHLLHLRLGIPGVGRAGESLLVHPTQLYAIGMGALGLLLVRHHAQRPVFAGQLALLAFMVCVAIKMLMEPWLLADYQGLEFGGVKLEMGAGVFFMALALGLLRRGMKRSTSAEAKG